MVWNLTIFWANLIQPLDKKGNKIFNAPESYDLYVFGKENTIVQLKHIDADTTVIFHDLEGKYLYAHTTASLTSKFGFLDSKDINDTFGRMISKGVIKLFNKNNKKYGYVNLSGKIIIPIEHSTLSYFSEGLVRASDPTNDKFIGYLDKTGKVVIPYEYNNNNNDDKDFTNGVAQVCQDTCFYINKQGKRVKKSNNGSKKNKPLSFF
ncbi:MAG: WG repeat-containing protein [Neisseriaceae bacterium]|nr:WG repeat-containing protein [Neisseriaceae bacterium]